MDELASNMGRVIPLAAAYNVEMDNLSASYAVMTANGIATAESTTYIKSMLGELGDSASAVSVALREETGQSFSQLMQNGSSLGDVLQTLGGHVNGDVTAFNQLWSSAEAGIGALSIFNSGADKFNSVLGEMQNSAGATEKAYRTMSDTTEYAQKRMETSFTNLKTVIGEQFNPTVKAAYNGIAEITNGITAFAQENPEAVAGVTALTTALAVTVGVLTAVSIGVTAVKAAFVALSAIPAVGVISLVIAGVAGLTAGIAALCSMTSAAEEEYRSLTAVSKQNYDAVQEATGKYQEACAVYGESSEQAKALRVEVAGLTEEYEKNKETSEDFYAGLQAVFDAHDELIKGYKESSQKLRTESDSVEYLIGKLGMLSEKSVKTASDNKQIESIVDTLNQKVPNLSLNYDKLSGSMSKSVGSVQELAKAYAQAQKNENDYKALGDLQLQEDGLVQGRDEVKAQYDAALENFQDFQDAREAALSGNSMFDAFSDEANKYFDPSMFADAESAVDEAFSAWENAEAKLKENRDTQDEITIGIQESMAAYGDFASEAERGNAAATEVVSAYKEEIDKLAVAYDTAYDSAMSSINGQIGLFDTMEAKVSMSTDEMLEAFESQREYLSNYTSNLSELGEMGFSQEFINSLSDGSEESAGYLQAIVDKAAEVRGSSGDVQGFVDSFNSSFEGVSTAKATFSDTVAEMRTGFTSEMDAIRARMNQAVTDMNMSGEAASSASSTINAYVAAIQAGVGPASTAASAVANAVSSILGNVSFNVPNVASAGETVRYAKGTASAKEDIFLAGEEGPELIVGQKGATVFTHEETVNILRSMSAPENGEELSVDSPWIAPQQAESLPAPQAYPPTPSSVEKTLHINLEGSGKIRVEGGGFTKSQMSQVLLEQLEPLLMRLLEDEMEEEGEFSHAF